MAQNIQSDEKQGPTNTKTTLPSNAIIKIEEEIKSFPDKEKLKEFLSPNQYYMKYYKVFFKKKIKIWPIK